MFSRRARAALGGDLVCDYSLRVDGQLDVIACVPWESAGKEESKMEINCLGCGFKVDLADGYDDYVGHDQVLRLWRDHGDRDPEGQHPGSRVRDGGAAPFGRGGP